jgi:hypothetical protein
VTGSNVFDSEPIMQCGDYCGIAQSSPRRVKTPAKL